MAKSNKNSKMVKADTSKPDLRKFHIIGEYNGECADASITNENGMDITAEVFEKVFESDEYKKAIEHGWYIGFLGHPDDPNCMDFEHGCIVMTEGHIESDGKVYGKFNLVDTPVGLIVDAYQKAGVKFGISIRGAGDLIGNSVDPDTFVFRGFDLVTFPAFPDAIPEFKEIAASTDLDKRQKYKYVCKTVKDNLSSITSASTIEVLQSTFAKQSDEYKALEARKQEILEDEDCDGIVETELEDITASKLAGVTRLYVEATAKIDELENILASYRNELPQLRLDSSRKLSSVKRIVGKQLDDVLASNDILTKENKSLKQKIIASNDSNLIYKQKIETQKKEISRQRQIISSLEAKRSETVTATTSLKTRTSDLDAQNKELKSKIIASENLIAEYQDAFANLYASMIGANLEGVSVTASTNVDELKEQINSSSIRAKYNNLNRYETNDYDEPEVTDIITNENPNELVIL